MRLLRSMVSLVAAALAVLAAAACGGRAAPAAVDIRELLAAGRFAEARASAESAGLDQSTNRAAAALSLVAEQPDAERAKRAVLVLSGGSNGIQFVAAATQMLDLAFVLREPLDPEVSLLLVETALGAAGKGPFALPATPDVSVGAATHALATAALERAQYALFAPDVPVQADRLLMIWNGCFVLLGGSLTAADDVQAWRLFQSIGGLAVVMGRATPGSEFALVLGQAAAQVVESNSEITVAARCDLASPYDDLKLAFGHERKLLGRLEMALAGASGCSRGTYAPQTR